MISSKEVTLRAADVATTKAKNTATNTLLLSILAGCYIALAGAGYNTAVASIPLPSVARLVGGCVFPAGLSMVLLAGSELFTGNCLMPVGLLEKRFSLWEMCRNWSFVFIGNFIGAVLIAYMCGYSTIFKLFNNDLAVATIKTGVAKLGYNFPQAVVLGILCNMLVGVAVWMTYGAEQSSDKVLALFFPVMLFVLAGYEHSVANMFFIPAAIFANANPLWHDAALQAGLHTDSLTWSHFLTANLVPVTIGNIIGGGFIAITYWLIYLRPQKTK